MVRFTPRDGEAGRGRCRVAPVGQERTYTVSDRSDTRDHAVATQPSLADFDVPSAEPRGRSEAAPAAWLPVVVRWERPGADPLGEHQGGAVLDALALPALLGGEVGPLLARIAVDALAHQRMGGVEHGFHGGVAVALFAP